MSGKWKALYALAPCMALGVAGCDVDVDQRGERPADVRVEDRTPDVRIEQQPPETRIEERRTDIDVDVDRESTEPPPADRTRIEGQIEVEEER
jgi:hypothetical protein